MDKNKKIATNNIIIRNNIVTVIFAIVAAILFYYDYSTIPSILLILNGIILLHSAYLLYTHHK